MSEVSKAKKIYNIVSTAIIAVIFVFLVVVVSIMLVQRKSGNGDAQILGYYMFEVVTDSMSGTLEPGEVILAKSVDDKNTLQEGDIITFIAPSGFLKGQNVTHRIIEVARNDDGTVDYFITKGDNAAGSDNWRLSPDSVRAKFVRKSVFIGGLRRFLSHWYGYVLLIALPLTVVGVLIIVGVVRDKIKTDKAKDGNADASAVADLSEEQKRSLLEELLKSQNKKDDTDD